MFITPLRRSLLSVLLICAMALVVAACGGDDDSSSSSASGGDSASASKSDGDCGATEQDDLQIVRHCGDATGEITVGDDTVSFEEGACINTDAAVVVNLGTSVVDPSASESDRAKHDYLGLLAGQHPAADADAAAVDKDGTFSEGVLVSAVVQGANVAATGLELTLEDDRTSGSFTGTDVAGKEVTGTFSCD